MLSKLRKNNNEGFTIIEVMIVLAIAGLILLIVFLAIPALQRNSRNTQRKNDVGALLAAVSEYTNNNSGVQPSSATPPTYANGLLTINPAAPATASAQAHVGFYQTGIGTAGGDVNLDATGTVVAAGTFNNAAHDYVDIIPGANCNGTASQAQPRSVAAVYEIESAAGAYAQQCQSS